MTRTRSHAAPAARPRRRLLSLLIAQALSLPAATHAATVVVDSTMDDGTGCTFREAVVSVNFGSLQPGCTNIGAAFGTDDSVEFAPGVEGQTITLTGGQMYLSQPISINPSGTIQTTIDANNASRIFEIQLSSVATEPVRLSHLTLANGYTNIVSGGAIYSGNSDLVITNCVFSGNGHRQTGGALSHFNAQLDIIDSVFTGNTTQYGDGGALQLVSSSVTISGSTFENNTAAGNSGAIRVNLQSSDILTIEDSIIAANNAYQKGAGMLLSGSGQKLIARTRIENNTSQIGRGGGIYSIGSLQLDEVSISGNRVLSGNGIGGGLSLRDGNLTLTNSLVTGNSSGMRGTAIHVEAPTGTVDISNTTISANSLYYSNGSYTSGFEKSNVFLQTAATSLNNVTITGNELSPGGAFVAALVFDSLPVPAVSISNTIIANTVDFPDCISADPIALGADVIVEDNECGGSPITLDPILLPLADNGGPTLTHLPDTGSPAIDAGDNGTCAATDQRGIARPADGNADASAICDIGAVEIELANQPPIAVDDTATTRQNIPVTIEVAFNDSDIDGNLDVTSANTACGLCSTPSNGQLFNNGDGSFNFTPDLDFVGADAFIYEICDTEGACDTADVAITVDPPSADVRVTIAQCVDKAAPDSAYRYALRTSNSGPDTSESVMLNHAPIPGAMIIGTSSAACNDNGTTVECDLGPLAPGAEVNISVEVLAPGVGAQTLTMSAAVAAATSDPDPADNVDQTTVEILPGLIVADGFEACGP